MAMRSGRGSARDASSFHPRYICDRKEDTVLKTGETVSWSRTFTEDDVRIFGQVSADQGVHHLTHDHRGRLMVQGLLTATLPSKVGGDINFIAREMLFRFHLPVYAGDTIHCAVTFDEVTDTARGIALACSWRCTNQDGELVMSGGSSGIVKKPAAKDR